MYWFRACAHGWGSTFKLLEKRGDEAGSGGGGLAGGGAVLPLTCVSEFNVKHGAGGAASDNGGAEGKKAVRSSS